MLYRYGRLKDGTLLQGLMGSDGPFSVPADQHRQNLADAHGMPAEAIELVETDTAPDLTGGQPPRPVPVDPAEANRAAIRSLAKRDVNAIRAERSPEKLAALNAELLEAVQALIRRHGV